MLERRCVLDHGNHSVNCLIAVVFAFTVGILCDKLHAEDSTVVWIAPEAVEAKKSCFHKVELLSKPPILVDVPSECHSLVFWRIRMDSAKGDWHLLNDEDKNFLKETAERIASKQYKNTKIEYTSVEGKLPE